MAGVDSLLKMVVAQAGDELRLSTDEAPRMLTHGAPLRLSIPATSDDILRHLLGPLLDPEREAELRRRGRLELEHVTEEGQRFTVELKSRGAAPSTGVFPIEAIFRRGAASAPRPTAARAGSAAPAQAAPAPASAPTPPSAIASFPSPSSSSAPRDAEQAPELARLLQRAVALLATDLHLAEGEPASVRIDGALRRLDDSHPLRLDALFGPLLDDAVRAQLALGHSVDLALSQGELGRFRINLYRSAGGLAAAVRILPRSAPAISELHLPVELDDLLDLPHGLVLICGATGSGKSATLAALAQAAVRRRSMLLISLEDPIEYVIHPREGASLVRQRQIGRDVRDFPTGLRDALREDPDLLLIGEMRDRESISLAITAAETGRLVLATLHSRGTASAIDRILDSYPAGQQSQVRIQLAEALRAVIAQRLLPRARGPGRVPAVEVLRRTHTVANLLREGRTAQLATVLQSGGKEGMIPLERCLADLVRSGQVSRDSARAAANDLNALEDYLVRA
ncbi:MAG: type IV pilus twitching motility protein PilT [Polyangia bacterium]